VKAIFSGILNLLYSQSTPLLFLFLFCIIALVVPQKESHFADANPRVNDKPTIFLSHKYTQAQTL
jgi:hypothetical protein